MNDETTARDRAIEMDVDEALELAERVSAPGSAGQSLAAEVRRLRALAGAPTADVAEERFPRPRVAGRCPSCRGSSLFLGSGGHVTCSRQDCPAPGVVDDQLHGEGAPTADVADLPARFRAAAEVADGETQLMLASLARRLERYPYAVEAIGRALLAAAPEDIDYRDGVR